ncbi:unnamed protein product, partial [Rotaria sordida]
MDNICYYMINKSDNSIDSCISDQCYKYIDPYSIMVTPNNCKTNLLYLSFSSYKNYSLFINRIKWKLSDLFPSRSINGIRLLRIFINYIDYDDQPVNHNELIRLGNHIDLYELFIKNLPNNYYLDQLIHYDQNYPQWYIIKVQFICNSLIIYNENACSSKIVIPSLFSRQHQLFTKKQNFLLNNSSLITYSNIQSYEQNQKSIYNIIIILIPLLIILVVLIVSILVYRNVSIKRCSNIDLTTIRRRSSSIPTLSNDLENKNSVSNMDTTVKQTSISNADMSSSTSNEYRTTIEQKCTGYEEEQQLLNTDAPIAIISDHTDDDDNDNDDNDNDETRKQHPDQVQILVNRICERMKSRIATDQNGKKIDKRSNQLTTSCPGIGELDAGR